jgi:hypothetical protein
MTRVFPTYVGGALDGEYVPITPKGERTLQVPHSPDFNWTDPTATIDYEIVYYRRETIRFAESETELDAWIQQDVSLQEAAETIWNQLLDSIGAHHEV